MSVVAPPPHDEPELLIREARARQRQRRAIGVALVAGAALTAFGINAALTGRSTTRVGRPKAGVPASASSCGIRVAGTRILRDGGQVYRDPSRVAMSSTVRCR